MIGWDRGLRLEDTGGPIGDWCRDGEGRGLGGGREKR